MTVILNRNSSIKTLKQNLKITHMSQTAKMSRIHLKSSQIYFGPWDETELTLQNALRNLYDCNSRVGTVLGMFLRINIKLFYINCQVYTKNHVRLSKTINNYMNLIILFNYIYLIEFRKWNRWMYHNSSNISNRLIFVFFERWTISFRCTRKISFESIHDS